ncbi:MAG: hypothetical protein CL398_07740 [Acidiferrobacteraceae bacterium]|nr:hypothetical protein [Acidiferrobacteraceae bacterium]|tara:strand:+ start:1075 stop:1827 length:753 start_codon:yes stop_codon:yes gene_type:complete
MSKTTQMFAYKNLRGIYDFDYDAEGKLQYCLEDPDQAIAQYAIFPPLKQDQKTTINLLPNLLNDGQLVIKAYNTANRWHAVRRSISNSRAENCWIYAKKLQDLGFSVADPVAFIQEYILGRLKGRSWYLYKFIDGRTWADYLRSGSDEPSQLQALEKIINTLNSLWDRSITHGDTKSSNILLSNDQILLLDLDVMKQHDNKRSAASAVNRDATRFLRDLKQDYPNLYEFSLEKLGRLGWTFASAYKSHQP